MCKVLIKLFIIGFFFVSCDETLKGEIQIVSPEEMQTLLQTDNVQLVDVRTPKEFKDGYIDNAENIDFFSSTFNKDIKKLNKKQPVLLYCRSGRRSAKFAKKLIEAGFVKVYDLEGGFTKWKHKGFKIKTTP